MKSETILITGYPGFVASHLASYYNRHYPFSNIILTVKNRAHLRAVKVPGNNFILQELDVTDKEIFEDIIAIHQPGKIFHLAGQSSPVKAFSHPEETRKVNVEGTRNLFEAIVTTQKSGSNYDPVVIIAGSGSVYGNASNIPVTEDEPLRPIHPYGGSKAEQDKLAMQYFISAKIKVICARIFNTTGKGKTGDVLNDFISRALAIKKGESQKMICGNLESRRAILDIRDLVSALVLLSDKGHYGEAYNICSETLIKTGDILPLLEAELQIKIETQPDPALFRTADEQVVYGTTAKLKNDTGWRQQYVLRDTIREILASA